MSSQTYCTPSGASCRHAFMCLSLVRSGVSGCGPSKRSGFGGHWGWVVVILAVGIVGRNGVGRVQAVISVQSEGRDGHERLEESVLGCIFLAASPRLTAKPEFYWGHEKTKRTYIYLAFRYSPLFLYLRRIYGSRGVGCALRQAFSAPSPFTAAN